MKFFSKTAEKFESFNPTKVRAIISMAGSRIRNLKGKRTNWVKNQQRSIANILVEKKYQMARILVEQCMEAEKGVEGLDSLLVILETVAARVQILANSKGEPLIGTAGGSSVALSLCPVELKEAVTTIIWSSSVLGESIPELIKLRGIFGNKYGKDFVQMSLNNSELSVSQDVIRCFAIHTKPEKECMEYLRHIAEIFGVDDYDESVLESDPKIEGIKAAGNEIGLYQAQGKEESQEMKSATIRTSCGLSVERMSRIEDDLDRRLDYIRLH